MIPNLAFSFFLTTGTMNLGKAFRKSYSNKQAYLNRLP